MTHILIMSHFYEYDSNRNAIFLNAVVKNLKDKNLLRHFYNNGRSNYTYSLLKNINTPRDIVNEIFLKNKSLYIRSLVAGRDDLDSSQINLLIEDGRYSILEALSRNQCLKNFPHESSAIITAIGSRDRLIVNMFKNGVIPNNLKKSVYANLKANKKIYLISDLNLVSKSDCISIVYDIKSKYIKDYAICELVSRGEGFTINDFSNINFSCFLPFIDRLTIGLFLDKIKSWPYDKKTIKLLELLVFNPNLKEEDYTLLEILINSLKVSHALKKKVLGLLEINKSSLAEINQSSLTWDNLLNYKAPYRKREVKLINVPIAKILQDSPHLSPFESNIDEYFKVLNSYLEEEFTSISQYESFFSLAKGWESSIKELIEVSRKL